METNRMHFELFMQFVTMVGTMYLWEPIFILDAKQWQQKPHKRISWYSLYADIQFSWMEKRRAPKQKSCKKSQLVSRGKALLLDIMMGVASYVAFIVCNWFAGTWLLFVYGEVTLLLDTWFVWRLQHWCAWEIIVQSQTRGPTGNGRWRVRWRGRGNMGKQETVAKFEGWIVLSSYRILCHSNEAIDYMLRYHCYLVLSHLEAVRPQTHSLHVSSSASLLAL